MAHARIALLLLGTLALSHIAAASPRPAVSAPLAVSITVVRSCGVSLQPSGSLGVRCTRGAADRVVVADAQPRVVMLERDGTTMAALVEADGGEAPSAERVVTLQF
jgi:hypothetical protein